MDRNDDARRTEDATEARQHVQNAEENRDALAAQAERTRATTPAGTDAPVPGADPSRAAQDPGNAAALREAAGNRDALAEQNRRVAATRPDDVPMTGPDNGTGAGAGR